MWQSIFAFTLALPAQVSLAAQEAPLMVRDELVVRTLAGDSAARRTLGAIARSELREWNSAPRTLDGGRALAGMLLTLAHPLTPLDKSPHAEEIEWRRPAVRVLRQLAAMDSTDTAALLLLESIAPYPYIWANPTSERAHLRAAARHAALPTTLATAHVGLALELGDFAEAREALAGIPPDSLPLPIRSHLAARVAYASGDSAAGLRSYYAGARAIATVRDAAWYFTDPHWLATEAEREEWLALPLGSGRHAEWLEAFWTRRDLDDARIPGSRVAEQYRRLLLALREYRWDLDGSTAEGIHVPVGADNDYASGDSRFPQDPYIAKPIYDNRYFPVSRLLDDRGRLVLRHGKPTDVIQSPGIAGLSSETLVWHRTNGQLMVSFSRASMPNGAGENTSSLRFGMLARNYPTGDLMSLCRRDPSLCMLAGLSALPVSGQEAARNRAEQIRLRYTSARVSAEATEGNPERFKREFPALFQAYGIAGGQVLLVAAIPVSAIAFDATSAGPVSAALRFRAVIGDPVGGRIVATLDTLRRWQLRNAPPAGSYLTFVTLVPVPTGSWRVSLVAGDTLNEQGAGFRAEGVPVIPLDGTALRLSDLILGRSGSGVTWPLAGRPVALNPTNAWSREDEAPLFYELDGLVVGRNYALEVELWETDGKPKAPRTRIALTITAAMVHQRGEQVISFRELRKGDYRLLVRVKDPVSGAVVERSRLVAVR
jgi:hypothetical protein